MSKNYIVTCIQFMLVAVRALLGRWKGRRNVFFIVEESLQYFKGAVEPMAHLMSIFLDH